MYLCVRVRIPSFPLCVARKCVGARIGVCWWRRPCWRRCMRRGRRRGRPAHSPFRPPKTIFFYPQPRWLVTTRKFAQTYSYPACAHSAQCENLKRRKTCFKTSTHTHREASRRQRHSPNLQTATRIAFALLPSMVKPRKYPTHMS